MENLQTALVLLHLNPFVHFILGALNDATIKNLLFSTLLRLIFRQTKIHNIGATLVGVDKFGNKYYEKLEDTQFG